VTYYNDTEPSPGQQADGLRLLKASLRLHHATIPAASQQQLDERIGDSPTVRDGGFAMSFWLAAVCAAVHEQCRAQAQALLASTSTTDRMKRVLRVQQEAVEGQFGGSGAARARRARGGKG
jgi:hypothetical protein